MEQCVEGRGDSVMVDDAREGQNNEVTGRLEGRGGGGEL